MAQLTHGGRAADPWRNWQRLTVALVLAGLAACSSDPTGNPGPGGAGGGFALSLSANAVSVARNGNGTITVTVNRTGSFTGAVTLTASGLAAGVTATFNPAQVGAGQTTSTLTLAAGNTSAAGASTLTITGSAQGVQDQNVNVQLTVTAPVATGPFALSLSVSSFLALPPQILTSPPVLSIARNAGFTGAVAVTVSGVPPGLVVGVVPNQITGSTASVLILNGGAANGTYTVTLRGTGGGGEQSISFQIVVAPPSTGSIRWEFCPNAANTPQYFLAVKDGNGTYTRIVPAVTANGIAYSFNITQSTATVALVTPDSGGFRTTYFRFTAQEMAARAAAECALNPGVSTRTVAGTVTGFPAGDMALVSMGFWSGSMINPSGTTPVGSYNLLNLPAGPLDLLSFRNSFTAQAEPITTRGVIRRAQNPAAGATLPVLDLNGAESFAMTTSTWTFGNANGEAFSITQLFRAAGGTTGLLFAIPGIDRPTTVRSIYGVPLAQTVAGDLQQVIATIQTPGWPRATRQIIAYHRTFADRQIDFGPPMTAPGVSVIAGGSAGRLRAQGTLPTVYNTGVTLDATQTATARYATIHATRGFLGAGSNYDLQMDDLGSVLGWDTNFAIRTASPVTWIASGGGPVMDFFDYRNAFATVPVRWTGAMTGITAPADGTTYLMARVIGSITP